MTETDPVVLRYCSTAAEAHILVSALAARGIIAVTTGDALADEVAIARKVMGQGVAVVVQRGRLDEAAAILEESRKACDALEQADDDTFGAPNGDS